LRSVTVITSMNLPQTPGRGLRWLGLLLVWILITGVKATPGKKNIPVVEPVLLIQRAAENEVEALERPAGYEQYFERLEWSWGTETRAVIETQEGRADRVVKYDDEALAPDQVAQQEHRLHKLLADHGAQKAELKEQRSELRRRVRMMKAFPKAFLFEPAGEDDPGIVQFRFRPNPKFSPKDRETHVYRGMQGTVWVDAEHEQLIKIEGVLVKDVSFGWGILGKLHKGGKYEIEQEQVSVGVWRITRLDLDLRGRMFLEGFHLLRKEQNMDFQRSPDMMTYRDALERLLLSPPGPAGNRNAGQPGASRGRSN